MGKYTLTWSMKMWVVKTNVGVDEIKNMTSPYRMNILVIKTGNLHIFSILYQAIKIEMLQ